MNTFDEVTALRRGARVGGGGLAAALAVLLAGAGLALLLLAVSLPIVGALLAVVVALSLLAGAAAIGVPVVIGLLDAVDSYRHDRDARHWHIIGLEGGAAQEARPGLELRPIVPIRRGGELLSLPALPEASAEEEGDGAAALELLLYFLAGSEAIGLSRRAWSGYLTRPQYDYAISCLESTGLLTGRGERSSGQLVAAPQECIAVLREAWGVLQGKGYTPALPEGAGRGSGAGLEWDFTAAPGGQ